MTEYVVTGEFRAKVKAETKADANRKLKKVLFTFDNPEFMEMERVAGVRVREPEKGENSE